MARGQDAAHHLPARPAPLATLPLLPATVGSAPVLPPGGKVGRTLAALVATAAELRLFAIESGRSLAGINGGTLQGKKLRGYSNVRGLVLDGTFDFGSATLTVRGTGAAHGKVRLTVDRLVGTLGGKHVVARLY